METQISGIPCRIEITHFDPGDPGRTYGPPEDCWPPEPAEIDFDVYVKGVRATWLERKLTDEDVDRILAEYLEYLESL